MRRGEEAEEETGPEYTKWKGPTKEEQEKEQELNAPIRTRKPEDVTNEKYALFHKSPSSDSENLPLTISCETLQLNKEATVDAKKE